MLGFALQGEDGSISRDRERANLAAAEISEGNNLVFTGALFTRGAFAEVGAELNALLPGGESRLAGTEGITMRVKTEGHTYACVLRTGGMLMQSFGWCVVLESTGGSTCRRAGFGVWL